MSETKQAWCLACDSEQTFYSEDGGQLKCSICEAFWAETPQNPMATEAELAEGEPGPPATVESLQDDLDHIRIQLSGPWSNEDLKNLALDLEESAAGAKEGGLGLAFFAVKKTAARKAREAGAIIVPFRDRHGRIMSTPPLSLSPNKRIQ